MEAKNVASIHQRLVARQSLVHPDLRTYTAGCLMYARSASFPLQSPFILSFHRSSFSEEFPSSGWLAGGIAACSRWLTIPPKSTASLLGTESSSIIGEVNGSASVNVR
ncbi:hypothetical protein XPA_004137 [Xanthoria parietina]